MVGGYLIFTRLTMSQRKAVTKATAVRYRSAPKTVKATILAELCALTGWHRDHARKAPRAALGPKTVARQRKPRPPVYGEEVLVPLRKVWVVLDAPTGKRLAPFMPEIVSVLERAGELEPEVAVRAKLVSMSAPPIDRRLAQKWLFAALQAAAGAFPSLPRAPTRIMPTSGRVNPKLPQGAKSQRGGF